MYITPDTNIRLLSGVRLSGNYENSIYFASLADQTAYFIGKTKYNLTGYTFNRVTNGVSRVGIPVNNLYDCNYMMFQNSAYGNKWFYAFITSVEFVNNITTEIQFTIDVVQTWLFDMQRRSCFIERCHSATDNIGDNILPEPVETGEFVYNSYGRLVDATGANSFLSYCYIVGVNDVTTGQAFAGAYNGVASGTKLMAFNSGDLASIETLINSHIQQPDAITCLYVIPAAALGWIPQDGGEGVLEHYGIDYKSFATHLINAELPAAYRVGTTINGYTPKNKKLFTYPYNYLEVITGAGNALNLRYEFFNGTPSFVIGTTVAQPVEATLRPRNYKGADGDVSQVSKLMNDEQLTLTGFPQGSWINDAYEAWVAQNSVPLALNAISQVGSGFIGGLATGNPIAGVVGAGMAGLGAVTGVLSERYQASIAADQSRGNPASGNIQHAMDVLDFFCGRRSITAQFARIIDDYFTAFGYANKSVGVPPIHNRSGWTYVKTLGADFAGAVPSDDMTAINGIFDKGIRFWTSGDNIGNFSGNNSVL